MSPEGATMRTITISALALALLAACAEDKRATAAEDGADAGAAQTTTPDAASDNKPIPLLTWVDDLIDHHTRDDAVPDTVDDKNIEGTEDPAAFDKYLQ
jgi:hypothetical protein